MNFMPIQRLGPHVTANLAHFGVLLPGINPQHGFNLEIRLIHEDDQFIHDQRPHRQAMTQCVDPVYGDFWETTVDLSSPGGGRTWGRAGRYVYRYALIQADGPEIDWIIDPFAREFGTGRHAAFTYGYSPYTWSGAETAWRTPRHHDLVLYELNILEFAGSLAQAVDRLDYLQDLGVTCISLMPVTNVTDAIDWGYMPTGYFGVDERFGKRNNFQQFLDAAHQRGLAVLVDAIYGHTSSLFAYEYLYSRLPTVPNPMMGSFSKDLFGPSTDWTKAFTRDFFYTVNRHWLEVYHVDGFRYDCVPNYWELGPYFRGYADIVYHTYQWVKSQIAAGRTYYLRFQGESESQPIRLIQCAEQLEAVKDVLEQTYSTCTWQNGTLSAASNVAEGRSGALRDLGWALSAVDLPTEQTVNGDRLFKSPLQYIETHDQNRFICHFGVTNPDPLRNCLFEQGDRSRWYKVQPYLIGLLMSKGIPLLWQGQELCENSTIASGGTSRTGFLRIVHWEFFYDQAGRSILTLVRKLLRIRAKHRHIRDGEHYFFNHDQHYHQHGVLLFARHFPNTPDYTLVAVNFTDTDQWVPFWFPVAGNYHEELKGTSDPSKNLTNVPADTEWWLQIPSNYGRIWTHV